jgi:SHS2 domain-containing protein
MPDYEELDHTADIGIRVRGATLAELFAHAAEALFALILPAPRVDDGSMHVRDIALSAAAPDLLLRAWLAELLYVHTTKGLVFTRFEIPAVTDTMLTARAHGLEMTPAMRRDATEIKAVTYHGLRAERMIDGWEADIIFDA